MENINWNKMGPGYKRKFIVPLKKRKRWWEFWKKDEGEKAIENLFNLYREEIIFDDKEVTESLPGGELSDADNLKYFFDKYISSVERGKPNQRMADHLKSIIDVIQVKSLTNEQHRQVNTRGRETA